MGYRLPGSSIVELVSDIVRIVLLIAPMILASAALAGLIALADRIVSLSWYVVLIAAPALYLVWLYLFLIISGAIIGVIGPLARMPAAMQNQNASGQPIDARPPGWFERCQTAASASIGASSSRAR